jgi:hypothetical protein
LHDVFKKLTPIVDSMISLWLREQDRELFGEACDLGSYQGEILTGELENTGVLAKLRKQFVLGKEGIWKPRDTDQEYHFVRIDNNSAYPDGLVLTPYSETDVKYHLRTKTIDETTRLAREELAGADSMDFVERVFGTYYGSVVRRLAERDQHFILYSVLPARPAPA